MDPVAHGGSATYAFRLIIPALPGHGFSGKALETGWNTARIARAWAELMRRLGYSQWVAQGGDWGCNVSAESGSSPTEEESRAVRMQQEFEKDGCGYSSIETSPQTLGYGLADSPVGQAAWIYEKLYAWSDHEGELETILPMDEMLDDIMLYWLSNAAASSARLYWEKTDNSALPIILPVGVSQFGDVSYMPKHWASGYYKNIIHWKEVTHGGHFAAWEQLQLLCCKIRECFSKIRSTLAEE